MATSLTVGLDRNPLDRIPAESGGSSTRAPQIKKADVVKHLKVFHHVGLLSNEPPESTGLPLF
jgi:hypothetical protein